MTHYVFSIQPPPFDFNHSLWMDFATPKFNQGIIKVIDLDEYSLGQVQMILFGYMSKMIMV